VRQGESIEESNKISKIVEDSKTVLKSSLVKIRAKEL
jgi:hypothetical protein